jgi:hypothetical protein
MATFSKGPESIVSIVRKRWNSVLWRSSTAELAGIPVREIGEKVGSLKDQRHAIIAARASDELRDILSLAIFHTSEK